MLNRSIYVNCTICTIVLGVRGGLVVSVLDSGFKSRPGQKFGSTFLLHMHPLASSAMMSTLTVHCQWEDEPVSERISHPPKKLKSL